MSTAFRGIRSLSGQCTAIGRMLSLACLGLMIGSPAYPSEPKLTHTLEGHEWSVASVAWSPDGQFVASADGETIKLWDALSGKNTATLRGKEVDWELSYVSSVAYSPDGKTLASGGHDKRIRVWDAVSGENTATLSGMADAIEHVAWSPDGKTLLTATEGMLCLWNVAGQRTTPTLEMAHEWTTSVAWSPDGKRIASASGNGTITLWEAATGKAIARLGSPEDESNFALAFSPDGKTIATGCGCVVKLWDVAARANVATFKGHSCELRTEAHGDFGRLYVPAITAVAFSPDGRTLASASQDKSIILWDVVTGKKTAVLEGHSQTVRAVAFSPNGKALASASNDNSVRLWTIAAPQGNHSQRQTSSAGDRSTSRCTPHAPREVLLLRRRLSHALRKGIITAERDEYSEYDASYDTRSNRE